MLSLSKNILKAQKVADSHDVVLVATSKDGMASREYTITILPQNTDILTLKYNGKSVTKGTIYADLNTTSTIELKAHLFGVDEEAADVKWTSSSSKVAAVFNGTVYLLGAGSATITAVCGSRKTAVTIKAAQMASSVSVSGPDEVASGKSIQLKASVLNASAQKVTWSIVQGAEYGKISTSGKFTANKNIISQQTVLITATAADGSNVTSEEFAVTVHPVAQSVQIYTEQDGRWLNRSNTTFQWDMSTALGNTMKLDARVFPCYGEGSEFNAIQSVTWKSSAPTVADIVNGQLKIYKTGSVTITATAADGSNQKMTFKLNVIKTVTSLTIGNQTVQSGKSINLNTFIAINPSDATNKKLTWTITSGSEYATISNGKFKAKKVTAVQTVEVTVSSQDGGASAPFTVTITP